MFWADQSTPPENIILTHRIPRVNLTSIIYFLGIWEKAQRYRSMTSGCRTRGYNQAGIIQACIDTEHAQFLPDTQELWILDMLHQLYPTIGLAWTHPRWRQYPNALPHIVWTNLHHSLTFTGNSLWILINCFHIGANLEDFGRISTPHAQMQLLVLFPLKAVPPDPARRMDN